jgi:hypothetical protein
LAAVVAGGAVVVTGAAEVVTGAAVVCTGALVVVVEELQALSIRLAIRMNDTRTMKILNFFIVNLLNCTGWKL